jgi:glycerol-3-phosphate dehydrogenase (NAD(P)+)
VQAVVTGRRITVVGAGSWGSALASTLAGAGSSVTLWARRSEQVAELRTGRNSRFLGDRPLAPGLVCTGDFREAVDSADAIVLATPAATTAELCDRIGETSVPCVLLAKGLERGTGRRLSEVAEDVLGARSEVLVLLGPSHAEEVVEGQPTAIVLAGGSATSREALQQEFSHANLRVYTNEDLVGVELAGALKNVLAIAAGLCDGLGLGDNAKGALLARGVAEIARIGERLGGRRETFFGLSGVGDVITTCLSRHSRNRALGERVGRGESLDEATAAIGQVVEGADTTRTVVDLARREGEAVPIATEVAAVLFEGKAPAEAMSDLMLRSLKPEWGPAPG